MEAQALHGHLNALLLAVLEQGALHGYAIIEALRASSDGSLDLPTGTVYPALRRLERAGYVDSSWSTVSGRNRRTYQLIDAGHLALAGERAGWREFSSTVGRFLGVDDTSTAPAEPDPESADRHQAGTAPPRSAPAAGSACGAAGPGAGAGGGTNQGVRVR